jgi:hypothetical protein
LSLKQKEMKSFSTSWMTKSWNWCLSTTCDKQRSASKNFFKFWGVFLISYKYLKSYHSNERLLFPWHTKI